MEVTWHRCVSMANEATGKPIYLDYNASTPIDPAVAAVMRPFLEESYGNPSSGHWASVPAEAALEGARRQVAELLGCAAGEVVFTSGGSEANNLGSRDCFFRAAIDCRTSSRRKSSIPRS